MSPLEVLSMKLVLLTSSFTVFHASLCALSAGVSSNGLLHLQVLPDRDKDAGFGHDRTEENLPNLRPNAFDNRWYLHLLRNCDVLPSPSPS